jgi:hypothetical protein
MVPLMNPGVQATRPSATTTHLPLHVSFTADVAANIDATSSVAKYARYIHQIMCFPPASTLLRALDLSEKLATISGLTTTLIKKPSAVLHCYQQGIHATSPSQYSLRT